MTERGPENILFLQELRASLEEKIEDKKFKKFLKTLNNQDLLNIMQTINQKSETVEINELKRLIKKSSDLIEEVTGRINYHPKMKEELTGIHFNMLSQLKNL